jgi:hypothetical protein
VVVLIIEVNDLKFDLIDPECDTPVFRYEQAPSAFSIASELVGFPGRDRLQFLDTLHVLQKGENLVDFINILSGQTRPAVVLKKAPQPFVLHISYLHPLQDTKRETR